MLSRKKKGLALALAAAVAVSMAGGAVAAQAATAGGAGGAGASGAAASGAGAAGSAASGGAGVSGAAASGAMVSGGAVGAVAGGGGGSVGKGDWVVTLVTGDRVVVPGGDVRRVRVEKRAGREKVVFRVERDKRGITVLPMDVSAAVSSGRLDRRLFEVSNLIRMGYDDTHLQATPLIVQYGAQSRSTKKLPGATTVRELPVIGGAAVQVPKNTSNEFLSQLGDAARARSAGIDKIWLDAKGHALLDQSVPQIGAPAAWKAGYTGKGIKIAVLDTGIDKTHPDLKTRVVGGKNFTTEPDGDGYGHGTHVASTIAGTAAASGGKYKGVAPDAQLLDGKVCDSEGGCEESAVIAAMEWAAVDQKAKLVNISLGWDDTPEVNPMEQTLNRLTAQTGTLFVVAAGNSGAAQTIGSPGSADAALTVGAVDKKDQLAEFSSQGPRLGDGAIKPDVTAPGVDIVAAKAKNSQIGDPVGQYYLKLSGTSMATPHVVGAAALLAQEHANWKAPELKAVLMGSAKKLPNQGVFAQGAGRIDVAKAITSNVLASPASLSFGKALWPHTDDKPVAKQLTYRNLGKTPVTLNLKLTASSNDGKPAPAGAFKLSATSLTVPAGGSASATVTSNTKHNGPDSLYSGQVVAAAAGLAVGTPFAVDKEIESYDLVLRHVAPDGKGTGKADTLVYSLDGKLALEITPDATGTAKLRLPKGGYFIDGSVGDDQDRLYQLVWPNLTLDHATTAAVDARKAKPIRMTLPHKDAQLGQLQIGYLRNIEGGPEGNDIHAGSLDQVFVASMGAPAPKADMVSYVSTRWGVPNKDGAFIDSPYTYNLVQGRQGTYFNGYTRTVRDKELAKVVTKYAADQPGLLALDERFGTLLGMEGSSSGQVFAFSKPGQTTHYLDTAGGITWSAMVDTYQGDIEKGHWLANHISFEQPYKAGKTYYERWGAAVAIPDVVGGKSTRTGSDLNIYIAPNADGDGHSGDSAEIDRGAIKLYRNGKLLAEDVTPMQVNADGVAPGKGTFRLESSQVRSRLQLATQMSNVWTFASQNTGDAEVPLPLWVVRLRPAVDLNNSVARRPLSVLPLDVASQPGAKVGAVKQVTVQVSGDGGKTWTAASVVRTGTSSYKAIFKTPAGAKLITVRSSLTDANGNSVSQSVINAYRIR